MDGQMNEQELCENCKLAAPTSPSCSTWPMAPPLVPSDAVVGVVPREGTGGGESTGAGDAPVGPVVMCAQKSVS